MLDCEILINTHTFHTTNFNGKSAHFRFLTIKDLFSLAEHLLEPLIHDHGLHDFSIPSDTGANSIVVCAKTKEEKEVVVKIYMDYRIQFPTTIANRRILSDMNIHPKILEDIYDMYDSRSLVVGITISEKMTPFSNFVWSSIDQKKLAVTSLLDKVLKLNEQDIVHSDIKFENICLNQDGEVFLIDFDNWSRVTPDACDVSGSSPLCYPPLELRESFIRMKHGNVILDLFPALGCALGDILGVRFWQFGGEQLAEKTRMVNMFNRGKLCFWIQHNLSRTYSHVHHGDQSFWYHLCDLTYLVVKESKWLSYTAFRQKASNLIQKMRSSIV